MDTFQPPPPLLPDIVSSPQPNDLTTMTSCFQKQQQVPINRNTNNYHDAQLHTLTNADDSVVQMMSDCKMNNADSGMQSAPLSSWPPATPSSSSSTTFNEYPSHHYPHRPPPSPPQETPVHVLQPSPAPQLPDIVPGKVVEEFEKIMNNENDKVVLTNSVCLLFRFSIDSVRGLGVCQAMSASPGIMSRLYYILSDKQFEGDDLILCYATGNLTNISKYEEGRAAILGLNSRQNIDQYYITSGVNALLRSLRSTDSNVVIFAITAIHNLLLDRRPDIQENAKEQIKDGIKHIVQLLNNQCLIHNYEFKVIVLDCLQILAYGNSQNRLAIKLSGGPKLILRTIEKNLDKHATDELIETASRVLKSLSACPKNKFDIIENEGISILTDCIERSTHDTQGHPANFEILKTSLWTLRNLSDLINSIEPRPVHYIDKLVLKLLHIIKDHIEVPCIITCALGIIANLTCNNEAIKQFICDNQGVELILNTIAFSARHKEYISATDLEIIEPAVCALCHLMNQTLNPNQAEEAIQHVMSRYPLFLYIKNSTISLSDDFSKVLEKLNNLTINRVSNSTFEYL